MHGVAAEKNKQTIQSMALQPKQANNTQHGVAAETNTQTDNVRDASMMKGTVNAESSAPRLQEGDQRPRHETLDGAREQTCLVCWWVDRIASLAWLHNLAVCWNGWLLELFGVLPAK